MQQDIHICHAFIDDARLDELEHMSSFVMQQGIFTACKNDSELVTNLSLKVCESFIINDKSFTDGEFMECCFWICADLACPEKMHS